MALLQKGYLGATPLFRTTAWFEDDALKVVDTSGTNQTVTANTAAHTKGAWTQLIASTAANASFLFLRFLAGANATDTSTLLDIGTGASGSETVIVPDLAIGGSSGTIVGFPCKIASGTRIAARIQSVVTGGKNATVLAAVADGGDYSTAPTTVDVITGDTATSKGISFSGASGTWNEAIASTSQAYRAVALVVSIHTSNSGIFTANYEVGIGASGNEISFGSSRINIANNELTVVEPPLFYLFGRNIPSGSRLAVKHSIAANPERYGFTLIGIP